MRKKFLLMMLTLLFVAMGSSGKLFAQQLLVNCDYNSSTEGYGVTKFSNYAGAYAYATANAKTATIVIEKTNTLSGNTFDNNHKNYSKLAVVIKDGATMGNAASKWDMTYPVTVEPGGTLACARPKNASVSNIHIKNKLIVGAKGATKKAYVNFLSDSYQDCDISIRYNGSIEVYNADFYIQDLDAQGKLTIEDSEVYVDGAFASATSSFYSTTLTNSTITINGTQIEGGLSDFAGGTSNQLGNVNINNSTLTINEGNTIVAANVTATNSAIAVNNLTVKSGKTLNLNDGSTLDAENIDGTGYVKIDGVAAPIIDGAMYVPVSEFAALKAAVEAGNNVQLTTDITTTSAIVTSGVTSVIDLNNTTLTIGAGDNKFNDESNITIKNGTVNINGITVNGNAIFCLDEYEKNLVSTLTFDEVNLTGENYSSAYGVFYIGESSVLNVNGGVWNLLNDEHEAGGVFKADASGAKLNIDGLNLTAHNVRRVVTHANTTIENSTMTISGDAEGVDAEMEHGFNRSPLAISNSTITMKDMVGRGITAQNGAVTISGNSNVNITNCIEATIDVRNNQTVTIDNTSTVFVDKEPTLANGCTINGTVKLPTVAKIGAEEYSYLADALNAAKSMTGDVTVEICAKVTMNQALTGDYTSIKFVGPQTRNNSEAEIYLDVQGYIEAPGKKVAFENLTLSKSAGGFINNAGFMNVAFGVYNVDEVTYTDCTFANGSYASSGTVTYTGCTFNRSHDKYGLWAYGNADITVAGCTFADYRGIKMYAENGANESTEKPNLIVENTNFSAVQGEGSKPAIVLTYGESVTLEGNTYSSTGVFELDLDGAPNGVAVTSDVAPTCINDNGACGVLVDGKIYTTVAQAAEVATSGSTVTLLHNSTETVELPYGVELDKNGFTANGVTVAPPAAKIGDVEYPTLSEAFAAVTADNQTVVVCKDVTENLTGAYLRGNITTENGAEVTITLTNSDWVYCPYTFVLDEYITLNVPGLFYYAGGTEINGTVVAGAYYQRYAGTKLTINEPGSMTVTGETCIIRYMDGDANAGIYIVGDNNNETVGLNLSVAYFYQGMINAKDANIKVGTYWQTNETDGQGTANLVLDNSTLTVAVYDHPAKATGNSTVTLKNGSTLDASHGGFTYGDNTILSVDATSKIIGKNGIVKLPVAKIGAQKYLTLEDAFKAATENCTIEILSDVTVDYAWDARYTGSKFTVPVTINGNGKTIKFTNTVYDAGNYLSAFRFEANATVNNLTIDMSEALSGFAGRFRAISAKANLTVEGCTFIGNGSENNTRAIIFGEGATAIDQISITKSTFKGWRRGISDNESGKDVVAKVTVTDNTLEDAAVYVSAKETVTFTGNKVEGAYVDIRSYSADNALNVTATGNTLEQNTASAYNYIKAGGTVDAQEEFKLAPVAKIGNVEYTTLAEAFEAAVEGDVVRLLINTTFAEELTTPAGITIDGNGKQINGTIYAGGNLTFVGHTKVTAFSASYYDRVITIGAEACLEVTGTGRVTLGYGNTFNITGTIDDAKNADKTAVKPSLIIPGGMSITGGNNATMNITNAYVQIGSTTSKNSAANGTFNMNFTNSIVEFTNQLTFAEPTSGKNPTFNVNIKDCVLTTGTKFIAAAPNSNVVVDNSVVTLATYFRNSGKFNVKNGSVLTGATIQFGENGGNNGELIVDASTFTITASSVDHALDGKSTGSITLKNEATASIDYIKDMAELYMTADSKLYSKTADLNIQTEPSYKVVYNENDKVYETADATIYVATKAELKSAIENAVDGTFIRMTANIDYGTDQLAITKNINLNLGGYTLTTANAYGGMSVKNNPTIKNGTIVYKSNTAAIKVWNATAFEDLVIDVQGKGDANKTIGGIVLQSGSTTRVGLIKNVTIIGAALTNGIETYNCGDATEDVIGAMENVTIDAVGTGMLISAPCGTATNCNIKGAVNGIEIWIKGNYSASLDLVKSNVEGGVYAHDEFNSNPGVVNNGTLSLTADEETTGAGVEDVTLTIARAENLDGVIEDVMEAAQAKIDNTYYITIAKAIEAAQAGETVTILAGTYPVPAVKAGITIEGEMVEGEVAVLFEGTLSGTLENLTMKNIHIKGSNAQRWAYAKGDLLFENVTFEATGLYALHFDGITEGTNLTYTNCTIIGWAAMGGSPASCIFDGCTIKGNGTYGLIRTYFNTTIKDCTFDVANVNTTDVYQDGIHAVEGAYVTVTGCTNKNGEMIDLVNIHALSIVKLDNVEIKHVATVTTKDGTLYYRTLADAFAAAGDGKNTTVTLLCDIDLAGAEWTPIGTSSNPFKGTFDGQDHTISNLVINGGSNSDQGFFGRTNDGEIKNVTFNNAKVSGRLNVGVVAGTPYTSKYTNITVTGHVEVIGMAYVGGVGGKNAYANWENITVDVDATSYVKAESENYRTYVGGVVGFNGEGGHTFMNISSNIKVKGSTCDIGGVFGIAHYGNKFENITFTGAVEAPADAEEVGGIAGVWHNQKGYTVTFTNCTSTGKVTIGEETTTGSIVGGAYNAANETSENSGSLIIEGKEAWLKVAETNGVKYLTLQAAINNVKDGGTVTLIDHETFTNNNYYNNGVWKDGLGYSGDKSFTIDLNEKTVSQDGSLNDYLFWLQNKGSKENTITIKNGTLDAGNTAYCALCTASSHDNKLTVNTENVTLINNNSNGSTVKIRGGSEYNANAGTKIIGKNSYLGIENWKATVNIYDGAEIYMNGTSSYNGCLVGVGGNGTINVYGGYGKGVKGGFIAMTSGGTINVSGGEWIANTNGTHANSNESVLIAQSDKQYNAGAGNSIVNVTGGTFRGGYNCYGNAAGDAQINISGGNFNADPQNYCAEGYVAIKNTDNTWTVGLAVATVNNVAYIDLQKAINAAVTTPTTITLAASFATEASYTIVAGQDITLDLNGKTISGTDTTEKSFGLINNNGTLTIVDNSNNRAQGALKLSATVNSGWSRYSSVISNQPGGKLTVNGGTIEHLGGTDMAYGIDNLTNGKGTYAETVVNGGTVKSTYRAIRQFLNGIEAQNILTVNGGTIEGANKSIWMQDPSKNANTGTLIVNANANLYGDVYLSVTEGSTEWPVEVAIVESAIKQGTVLTSNVPEGYLLVAENGLYTVETIKVKEQTFNLNNGWTWISLCVDATAQEDLASFEAQLAQYNTDNQIVQIKNQTKAATYQKYYENYGWYGNLKSLAVNDMYMVKIEKDNVVVKLEDYKVNPADYTFNLVSGWTWLGFPSVSDNPIALEEALKNITPNKGDQIKSQEGFATYMNNKWYGNLYNMTSGKGYMYRNTSGETVELVYPAEVNYRGVAPANITAANNLMVPNMSKYANNMSIIAVVNIDGEELMTEDFEVAAFAGEELRGSARPIYLEDFNRYMLFMTVYGEANEELTFKYYDLNSGEELNLFADSKVVFEINATVGSIEEALVLNYGTLSIDENSLNGFNVYPNPVNRENAISFETTFDKVEVYNSLGVVVAEYANVDKIDGIETAGIYVIKVTNDNTVKYCRVIVK